MWSTVFPTQHPYTYSVGEGCSIALCEDHPGTQCGRMGSLISPPLSFCFFQWAEKAFFISIKPPWWVQRGRNLYSHRIDKEGFQRSCDMWAREGLESKWDFLPSSRAWSRAPNCLADELSISVWVICRHLQLPSGSGLTVLTTRSINIRQAHTHTYLYITL